MARRLALRCCGLVLCAVVARAEPMDPLEILPTAAELGASWEVVEEVALDPRGDPDLLRWGVRAQRTRHYTRRTAAGVQVCSIEVWAFRDAGLARLAHQNFAYPGWQIDRRADLLIMLRGLTRPRRGRARRGLFPDCLLLGERARERAPVSPGGAD